MAGCNSISCRSLPFKEFPILLELIQIKIGDVLLILENSSILIRKVRHPSHNLPRSLLLELPLPILITERCKEIMGSRMPNGGDTLRNLGGGAARLGK